MPYRDEVEAQRLRCQALEGELAHLRLQVSVYADARRLLALREREFDEARRLLAGTSVEPRRPPTGRVVAIAATAGGLVAVVAFIAMIPTTSRPRIQTTLVAAKQLRVAAEAWRGAHASDACPTTDRLLADGSIDPASKVTDSWGNPYKIVCDDDETTVVSFGRDAMEGTADDVRVPEPPAER